ncbi:hypothetical protein NE237_001729 [Protea cynaroides]|uniref:Uncharacterized protein n=1 Tax=Protea cynaroides TaxID=273540 RepID=A0A9Q0KTN3_9MAGN|nr:hypothetical protein NE237_001729 [Protea cynaroides]
MPMEREHADQKGRADEVSKLASLEKKQTKNVSTMLNRAMDNLALAEVKVSNAENETARVRESIPLKITKALEEYKGFIKLTERVMREAASCYCRGAEAVHDWIRARDAD